MKKHLLLLGVLALSSGVLASALCGTGKVATKKGRVATGCQTHWTGFKYCYDETLVNGGCAAPWQTSTKCTEMPMTNPIELNIYSPSTDPSNPAQCSCIFQGTNTPNGQMKGVNGGTCVATPAPEEEPNPG